MKRWIHAADDKKNYTVDEKLGPGLVPGVIPGVDDDKSYGEQEHKSYRGVPIRDFRNDWLGYDDFDALKDAMDTLLDAFDIIESKLLDAKLELRFFNIGADDSVSLHFYDIDDLFGKLYPNIKIFNWEDDPSLYKDYRVSVDVGVVEYPTWITESSPEAIASAFVKLKNDEINHRIKLDQRRAKRLSLDKNNFNSLKEEHVDDTIITVPIDIEVDEYRYKFTPDDVPDDEEIIDRLNSSVNVEDVNRFIKNISVKFGLSGVAICLYCKLKNVKRLRVQWQGKTSQTQFEGACRSLSRLSVKYFDELKKKI